MGGIKNIAKAMKNSTIKAKVYKYIFCYFYVVIIWIVN